MDTLDRDAVEALKQQYARERPSWRGVTVDHLYPDCPSVPKPAVRQPGFVDPLGTDICGLCLRRWRT